ncbi:PRKCSH domain-containing protein [Favolaschia claudopus]|uniref:Protein OS-9 homolog n=1 Tax=Favolaschia claudopus TaxID=2862362 RepID=A0AAW0ANU3_9AGAR
MAMLSLFLLLPPLVVSRIIHAVPDDPAAFPKYNVQFLNHLPLANETAQQWLTHGLRGGIREFLDQPWDDSWHPPALGDGQDDDQVSFGVAHEDVSLASTPDGHAPNNDYSLEHLKMGPDQYLCLIPKPLEQPSPDAELDEDEDEPTPAHSWSLLLPLEGTCLYHRQAWFTYSYCHGRDGEIRQFRELIQARPSAGTHRPEEDPDWEAYTLGRAPPAPGADLTIAQQDALAHNLELARNAGSRYLVQRWGDGTLCDKNGKPREVEVQFHCSMATTDTIAFVKESKTCSYVMVVHTPRLCGEPGFMAKGVGEQASISCREIIAGQLPDRSGAVFLPDADHPLQRPRRKPVLPLPPPAAPKDTGGSKGGAGGQSSQKSSGGYSEVLRKALDAIKEMQWGKSGEMEMIDDGDGNIVIQFVDEIPVDGVDEAANPQAAEAAARDRIAAILREANWNVKADSKPPSDKNKDDAKKKGNGDGKPDANDAADGRREVDDLL